MRKFENKGFKNYSFLDNFIQKCLDCYSIVNPNQEYYDITGKYSKYLISHKSTIPDLVIYNNTFNKNDCFYDYYGRNYNTFPRVKFNINIKSKNKIKVIKEENTNENIDKKVNENNEEKNNKEIIKEDKNEIIKEDKKEIIKEEKNENDKINKEKINEEKKEIIKEEKNEKDKINKEKINEEKKEVYNDDKKYNEISDDEQDNYNDEDDDDNLTNPTQFFAQIQSNKEKFIKEISNNIFNESDEENKEILNSNIENDNKENKENKYLENIEKEKNIKEKKNIPNKNILINPKTKNNIIEAETESLTFIETKKSIIENKNINNNNSINNNKIINNNSNQNKKNIPMMPQINIPIMHPFIYMQNPLFNPNFTFPYNYSIMNQLNYMNFQYDDEEEDDDPMLNNFNDDYSKYNPSVFLEKPELIVKKNLFNKNWILIKNNKVFSNFNSEELLYYLGNQIRLGNKFENISICDYQTDSFFMPSNLFDILKNSVPKLKKKFFQHKMMEFNLNKNQLNRINNNNIMINSNNSNFNSDK